MIGILISGHGTFAEGVYSTVKLIAGEQPNVKVVNFLEEDGSESLREKITAAMDELGYHNGIVCFTDLAGGTPFNICSSISATNDQVKVIGGTNVPMLLSSMFAREAELNDFIKVAVEQGLENIKTFTLTKAEVHDEEGI